jgi:hypothetical protein
LKKSSLFHKVEKKGPKWADLKAAEDKNALVALTLATRNPTILRCRNTMLIPPLVTKSILEANTLDPATLLIVLVQEFKDFDSTSDTIKPCTLLRPVIEFLWVALKFEVEQVVFTPDSSMEGKHWSNALHASYISKSASTLDSLQDGDNGSNILGNIADSLRLLSESNARNLLTDSNEDENKKDNQSGNWGKIPDVIQQMILNISSTNDQSFPLSPCET